MGRTIGILGTESASQTQELTAALTKRGAQVELVNPKRLLARVPQGELWASRRDREPLDLSGLDALLIRALPGGSLEQVIFRLDALGRLEKLIPIINSPRTLEKTVDKYLSSALLAEAGLPTPRTVAVERFDDAMAVFSQWGRAVVKPVFGSLGKGILLLDDEDQAYRVFRSLEMSRYIFYLQEYLPHQGEDFRLFVVEGQVRAAMRRRAPGWKTNVSLGGRAEAWQPETSLRALAEAAAACVNAHYLGVDILVSQGQPYIIEINGVPGFAGLQTVTEVDIAGLLADMALRAGQ